MKIRLKMFYDWFKWYCEREEPLLLYLFVLTTVLALIAAVNDIARWLIIVLNTFMLTTFLYQMFKRATQRSEMDRPIIAVDEAKFVSASEPINGRRDIAAEVSLLGNQRRFICTVNTAKLGAFTKNDMAKAVESIRPVRHRGGGIHESWDEWVIPDVAHSVYGRIHIRQVKKDENLKTELAAEFAI